MLEPAAPDPLFPAFEAWIASQGETRLFLRVGGPSDGLPLLLLHGFPQSGAMWARVALRLLRDGRFRLVIPDLPGYGASRVAVGVEAATKRRTAEAMIAAMAALGHGRFGVAGHDRGGRVAYRLALEHPECVRRISVLDILPTIEYWDRIGDRAFAAKIYHWLFLAQPYPLPERLIGAAPDFYVDDKLARWSGRGDLTAFDPPALERYRANARDAASLRAMCDDYRAGASLDVEHDEADRVAGRRIAAPLLALWGGVGIAQGGGGPLAVWARWAERVEGRALDCGHFLPEERPEETAEALAAFHGREETLV